MCKIMAIPGVSYTKEERVKRFVQTARHFLTEIDRDGFGYAAIGEKGLQVERWLKPKHAFTGPKKPVRYSSHGEPSERCYSVLAHSRLATCGKEIMNVHPFVRGETALIHNGVITNCEDLQMLQSTCDSEVILNEYVDANVSEEPNKIQSVVNKLSGWYACAVLTKNTKHGWVLDVFKDDYTPLYYAFIEELNTPVICTSREVIELTARLLQFTIKDVFKIPGLSFMRFDAQNGSLLEWFSFSRAPVKKVKFTPKEDETDKDWDDAAYDRYLERKAKREPKTLTTTETVERTRTVLRKALPPEQEPVPAHKEPLKIVPNGSGKDFPTRWTPPFNNHGET